MCKIAFLIMDPGISGGVNVVFRQAMELAGREITTAIVCNAPVTRASVLWHPIAEMMEDPHLLWLDYHQAAEHCFDLAIATWWRTFFDLWKIKANRYAYFVQSIELRFYPLHERVVRRAVDATYDWPVGFVTEAKWVQRYLYQAHQQRAELAPNGVDKLIFTIEGDAVARRVPGRLRVLVEGPVDIDFKNVPASIRLARESNADEVWLLTSSDVTQVEGVDRIFSHIPQVQTAAVYRSCDVLLKLSLVEGMFGPPLEMFHCGGTSIVYNVTGHDEYIVHGRNGLVARMGDEAAIRRCITQLRDTPELLAGLKAGAIATAADWPGWTESGRHFQHAIERLLERPPASRSELCNYSNRIWRMVEDHWIQNAQAQQTIAELLSRVAALQGQLAESQAERNRVEAEQNRIEAEHNRIHELLLSTYRSSSWRMTHPVRIAKRALTQRGYYRHILGVMFDGARRGREKQVER